MRLGPILVPTAIVVAIGTIVAAQSGWLDGGDTEPLPRARHEIHGAPAADPVGADASAVAVSGMSRVGRSVGLTPPAPETASIPPATATATAHGSGGAGLDSDGAAMPPEATAGASSDALQQARDETTKAKQDVLAVTRASLESQRASEAELERQKAEYEAQIVKLRSETASKGVPSEATAQAEAKAATAAAELADAHERENALRTQLAALQAAPASQPADEAAAAKTASGERALADATARDKALGDKVAALQAEVAANRTAADKTASAERSLAEAQARSKDFGERFAALQAKVAADGDAAEKAASAETALAAAQAKSNELGDKVAALQADVAAKAKDAGRAASAERDLAAAKERETALGERIAALSAQAKAEKDDVARFSAKADIADKAQADLVAVRSDAADLNAQIATLQAGARDSAQAKAAAATAAGQVALLQRQLAEARRHEHDLGTTLAAAQADAAKVARVAVKAPAEPEGRSVAVAKLQDDLDGARRGETTLRMENGILQREVSGLQADNKTLGEKLAALQVGLGQPVPPPRGEGRRSRARVSDEGSQHDRLVRQLESLKREQMHQEVQALRIEASKIGTSRHGRRARDIREDVARLGAPAADDQPSPGRRTRRERQAARERDGGAPSRLAAVQSPQQGGSDATATIAESTALIRSGNVDQARALLRQKGTPAATRALADTYNPLTNTQYGVIGVDSDAEKASYLYQQAARNAAAQRR